MSTTKKKIGTVCHEWNYKQKACETSIDLCKVVESPNAFFFVSKLAVDADGDPRAYHPDDIKPPQNSSGSYDWLANISKSDLYGIQAGDDAGPEKGFYVSGTALANPNFPNLSDVRHWVPAASVPYVVLPYPFPDIAGEPKVSKGDCAFVLDLKTGNSAAAIFGDVGRAVGEGSIRLAIDLGLKPFSAKYPPKVIGYEGFRFFYLLFPGVPIAPPWDPSTIAATTQTAFEAWGGMARVRALFPELTALPAAAATPVGPSMTIVPPAHEAPVPKEVPMPRVLQTGAEGTDVMRWQLFLIGQGFDPGPADGVFGSRTAAATAAFQTKMQRTADGVVGRETVLRAATRGFAFMEEPANDQTGSNWPPRPSFPPLTSTEQRQAIFGAYQYVSAPQPDDQEAIRIIGPWEENNIVSVPIPQLAGVRGAPSSGRVRFHRLVADQLERLWAAWDAAGLLARVLSWEGSFNARFVRGSRVNLSNHAFGSAFDINYNWNKLGQRPALVGERGSVRELVPIANDHGFYWGGHFANRPDGMHFEIAVIK
jgi:peptidoglycan hydrolase-like protein with peptidoglycan-binding domain